MISTIRNYVYIYTPNETILYNDVTVVLIQEKAGYRLRNTDLVIPLHAACVHLLKSTCISVYCICVFLSVYFVRMLKYLALKFLLHSYRKEIQI